MSDEATPTGLVRIFRRRLLVLLSTSVALIGVALIIAGQFTSSGWHESLVGIGSAIFATGPITVMVWWVTDDLYRTEVRQVVAESNPVIRKYRKLGIIDVDRSRTDALGHFEKYMAEEIRRAKDGRHGQLWFVCTDLKGFLDVNIERRNFDLRNIIDDAAAQPTMDLRIMMADPEYTFTRSETGPDSEAERERLYEPARDLRSKHGVKAASIRFYAWRPTVFAIATSQHMLLNPYPHGEKEAHRCMSLIVSKTGSDADGRSPDIYSQYLKKHFEATWSADSTRQIDESPPLVSRIKVARDDNETIMLLANELSEKPPETADLLEFSGERVHDLLGKLAQAGTSVRLLLKHPDSAGVQQHLIVGSYLYLKDHATSDAFEVRFYRTVPSICGWRLDRRLLNLGWYTPDILPTGEISQWGIISNNPTVTGDIQTPDCKPLDEMFGKTFDGLWRGGVPSAEVDRYIQNL